MINAFAALVNEVRTVKEGKDVYCMNNADTYEELFMADVYYKVGQDTGLELEPSVRMGVGSVTAYKKVGDSYETVAEYNYADETDAMLSLLQNITDEVTESVFHKAVNDAAEIIKGLVGA